LRQPTCSSWRDTTTVNLICNGILALLHNPSQLELLRANPSRLPDAVEEFLRFESPLNIATVRFTTVAIQVGGVDIPAGELVMIALPANHDTDQFDEPDQLDITRKPNAHLAFSHGIHYCIGAHWPGSRRRSRSAGCWPGSIESCSTTRRHWNTVAAP
jgi:cytochrome P450